MIANVLTIAGSDPSGGAGIQADLKTFSALGSYGCAVLTALTAQNTRGVVGVEVVAPSFVRQQIDAVFDDLRIDAVKIGMLANAGIVGEVAACLQHWRPKWIVLDPVMVAKSGHHLLDTAAVQSLRDRLLPLATLATPNLPEAATLLDEPVPADWRGMVRLADLWRTRFGTALLLKGGHLTGGESPDLLATGLDRHRFDATRIETRSTHGTGCTLSAAIAALLPQSPDLPAAVAAAKRYLTGAIAASDRLVVGHGHGPVHHFHQLWQTKE
ncbi:bifunctional hydroxymethylpyrimidine kinase/phosphomethylpyrimidine kinase [Dongia rigui]|uniref:hydroxymethylpyrimidine kinase n=1 Tax=Dongia rigui TaxID=940149 RepID=A0ABU5DSZ7_9PROT|nr:bifunctional hydroxymethylpyrimidine kinase/phosphomethylpyrimidine kinase [Dongia rigui]MDY0870480.1 bifunctional hydroxymethylpyrimidine kinase/phosphomethylpyrimidine kinase [Dongia rigui]